ncbi:hypothetical protein JYU14_05430, partial [Simkania negevensis]|nr:hypothetical protein [Simkania negevensis]
EVRNTVAFLDWFGDEPEDLTDLDESEPTTSNKEDEKGKTGSCGSGSCGGKSHADGNCGAGSGSSQYPWDDQAPLDE